MRANEVCSHGAQGILDGASKGALENEFGTSNDDECMIKILERGEYQATTVSYLKSSFGFVILTIIQNKENQGDKNIMSGPTGITR